MHYLRKSVEWKKVNAVTLKWNELCARPRAGQMFAGRLERIRL